VQFVFISEETPQTYEDKTGKYPQAPNCCPHCSIPVMMRKHGFYKRYIIHFAFEGYIYIRRYICVKCGRTVSMLPSFCVPYYQHGTEVIILALFTAIIHCSVKYAGTKWPERPQTLTRRHIIHYRNRVKQNRRHIQLGLNLMSPGFIDLIQITGDTDWTRKFLEAVTQLNPQQFNSKYHRLMGKSFMSLHNNVA